MKQAKSRQGRALVATTQLHTSPPRRYGFAMSNNPSLPGQKGTPAGTYKPVVAHGPTPRGAKAFTREKWDALLAAFRLEPGNVHRASIVAGVSRETAQKAWDRGWQDSTKPWAHVRIQDVLLKEQEEARAALRAQHVREHEAEMQAQLRAREDAIQARKEEAQGSAASRKNALGLAIVANKALVAGQKVVAELQRRVDDPDGLEKMPLKDLSRLLELNARLVQRAENCMALALQIERVVAGEPIAILGHRVESMSPAQIADELQSMLRTFDRAERAGKAPKN